MNSTTLIRTKMEMAFPLDQAGWPVWMMDAGGTIRHANAAAVQVFGASLESGTTSLGAVYAETNSLSIEQLLAACERSAPLPQPILYRVKGGPIQPFMTHVCPWSRDGERRFVVQLFKQGGNAAATTAENGAAHKQRLECAMQLARTVALDFNNVLTTILGYTSLMLTEMEPENRWRNTLMQVEKAAERAAEISQQLATSTRTEKENASLTLDNLNVVLRRVADMFRQSTASRIDWVLELEEQMYAVRFDEAKLQQAFVKIVENSIEAAGQYGRIAVQSRNLDLSVPFQDGSVQLQAGCYVVVEIADDGRGIEADVLPRVFEPFFTTKPGHRGLGLALVYGIVTNHGGGVTVSSQQRRGTTVRIYLPADRKVVRERSISPEGLGGNQTLLVVDDEEGLLGLAETILKSYGYRVLTANSAEKALQVLQREQGRVDLVITDMVMPQISGRELAEQIHAISPSMRILFTSGYVRQGGAGMPDNYLAKPFTAQQLLWHVKQRFEQP